MIYTTTYQSPIGELTLASNGPSLVGLWFENQQQSCNNLSYEHNEHKLPIFAETKRWLDLYFNGKQPNFFPKIEFLGTDFQKLVWSELCNIEYGTTTTYKAIGQKVAKQMNRQTISAQAIGGAVGKNPIGIIVPCHRVIGTNGSLTGYTGGINRKIYLMKIERIIGL